MTQPGRERNTNHQTPSSREVTNRKHLTARKGRTLRELSRMKSNAFDFDDS